MQQVICIIHALTQHFLAADGEAEQVIEKTSVFINPTSPFSVVSTQESVP
jgi:hypothetical protein